MLSKGGGSAGQGGDILGFRSLFGLVTGGEHAIFNLKIPGEVFGIIETDLIGDLGNRESALLQ